MGAYKKKKACDSRLSSASRGTHLSLIRSGRCSMDRRENIVCSSTERQGLTSGCFSSPQRAAWRGQPYSRQGGCQQFRCPGAQAPDGHRKQESTQPVWSFRLFLPVQRILVGGPETVHKSDIEACFFFDLSERSFVLGFISFHMTFGKAPAAGEGPDKQIADACPGHAADYGTAGFFRHMMDHPDHFLSADLVWGKRSMAIGTRTEKEDREKRPRMGTARKMKHISVSCMDRSGPVCVRKW